MKTRLLYEEWCGWALWVHFLIGLTFIAAVIPLIELAKGNIGSGEGAMPVWEAILCLVVGFGFPLAIYGLFGQLRTRITSEGIDIRWGYWEVIKKRIPFEEIEGAEAVTYSPLGEFGGWGIRAGTKKKRGWTIRGNRALLLHLSDGTKFYLGSDKPERIHQWVQSEMKRREA
jgi:hypothetical protein